MEWRIGKIPCFLEKIALQSVAPFMHLMVASFVNRLFVFAFLVVPATLLAITLVEKHPPVRPADADSPTLIWDIDLKLANALPRNFRTTDDRFKESKGETLARTGLKDLRASGSGEFTPEGLKLLLARTRGPVTVFDLRQETHIFVNELPVSWYATNDWVNVGRSQSAIEADEASRVECASTEHDIVGAGGASYVRLTITDHARPLNEEVDRFILAVRALPENAWAHFHCEAGLGRTTTFMVLYDMLRNANRVSLEDIVTRQKILGNNYDVLQPAEPANWKAPHMADRAAFVRAFYDYARANPNGQPQLWSEWLKLGAR